MVFVAKRRPGIVGAAFIAVFAVLAVLALSAAAPYARAADPVCPGSKVK